MKTRVIKLLVKHGQNEQSAIDIVERNFELAVKSYPRATASFIADVVMVWG